MRSLSPGAWTSTGWGAQHRIRASEGERVTFVCHGLDQFAEASRVDAEAAETVRCSRCEVVPGLGPLPVPILGEVRCGPGGVVAACVRTWDGRVPATVVDRCWLILDYGNVASSQSVAVLDTYAVAAWTVVGAVPGLVAA